MGAAYTCKSHPPAGKLWQLKYRFEGKEKLLAFGAYPAVTLQDARSRREDAKKLLANGVNPGVIKKARKANREEISANSFEVVAREWHDRQKDTLAPSYAKVIISRLERDIFPWMGASPISEIEAPEVLNVLRRLEDRGANETAKRMKIVIGQVFRYAVATGRAKRDPTPNLKVFLTSDEAELIAFGSLF